MTRPQAMTLASQMYGDGGTWSVTEIRRYLNDLGVPCTWATVKGWVDPEYLARRNTQRRLMVRMGALRSAGLSFAGVATVMGLDHGLALTGSQVRRALASGAFPGSRRVGRPPKARA